LNRFGIHGLSPCRTQWLLAPMTDELRAVGIKLAWSTMTIGSRSGLCRLVPEQGMAPRPGTGLKGGTCTGHPERQLPLAAAHTVGAGGEFGRGQPKAPVHQITTIFL